MIRYLCKKCGNESPSPLCQTCGRKLPLNTLRDVWQVAHVPLSDGRLWGSILLLLCLIALLLFAVIFGAETFLSGTLRVQTLLSSSLPAYILSLIPLGLAVSLLFLALQKREVIVYVLDVQGAHLQTWHPPTRLRCWARLQLADLDSAVPQPDGTAMMLSQTRHLLWKDIRQVKYSPAKGEIRLYRTPRIAPMVLRLPPEEYEGAQALVQKFCKKQK